MSREIDVKALVSHLVRGDGADKCRICMGDTSEGQVYLGDTVMMDGERPVTLAELLQVITGVEVPEDADLPSGLCSLCSGSAIDAANFSILCRKANNKWNLTVQLLSDLSELAPETGVSLYALLQGDEMTVITDDQAKDSHESPCLTPDLKEETKKRKTRKKLKVLYCECPFCGKKYIYAEHLSQHLKDSPDYTRACNLCASIMNRDELIEHLKQVHAVRPFDCKKCKALFLNEQKLKAHISRKHSKGKCTCGECGCSFQTLQAYHAHQTVHIVTNCPGCDKQFRNRTCYIHHVRICCDLDKTREDTYITKTKNRVLIEVKNRVSKKKVKVGLRGSAYNECICDYCKKKFTGKKFVLTHIQIVHMKNTHTPCPYCGKSFAAAHMSSHLKTHDTAVVTQYKCEHCNLVLKTKLGYVQHLRLHTGERPYKCKHCGEAFSASSRRSEHIRKMHSSETIMKHACELCPAQFKLPYRLRKHMAAVHTEEAGKSMQFECPECHVKFSSCRGLIHHSRKHQRGIVRKPQKRVVVPMKEFSDILRSKDEIYI